MTRTGGMAALIAAVGIAGLLTACAGPQQPSATAPPAPSVTQSAAPAPEPSPVPVAPTARIAAGCDELIAPEAIDAALAADVALQAIGFDHSSDSPAAMAVHQLGAVNCVWANGPRPRDGESTTPSTFRGANLTVVPDGATPWQAYLAVYGPTQDPSPYGENALGPRCVAEIGSCFFQALVGTSWLDLTLTGVGAGGSAASDSELVALITPLSDALVETLSAEPAAPERWQVPGTVAALPSECTAFLSNAQVEDLSGAAPLAIGVAWDGPRVGQISYGLAETGAQRCHLSMAGADSGIGYFGYLPGGGWAFDELAAGWRAAGAVSEGTVPGLREGDDAVIRCGIPDEPCMVDVRFGGNWVQLNLTAYAPGQITYPEGVDIRVARDNVAAFAETLVANLNASSR